MTNFAIRNAVTGDVAGIEACVADAYAMYVERIGKKPAPMLDDYSGLVSQGRVWVAEDSSSQLLGLIVRWPVDRHLYIDNVATTTAARGRGVGKALLDHSEAAARAAGLGELRLYTNVAMVENLSYYLKLGFAETHREVQNGYDRVFYTKQVVSNTID